MKSKIEILKEKKKYIAFFPDIYHFFPCSEAQANFLENRSRYQKEARDANGNNVKAFNKKINDYIKLKEEELLKERQLKKETETKKNLEIFGKDNPKILGRLAISPNSFCNLKCKYCYNRYSPGKDEYKLMTPELALAALKNLYRAYDSVKVIHFIGSEPLLNIQLIESVCSWISLRFHQKLIKVLPVFAVITNGTVAVSHIIETLKKFKIQLVVSVDGNKDVNDANRVYINGQGTYRTIRENFHRFAKAGLKPKIQVTYTKQHILQEIRITDLMKFFANEFNVNYLHVGLVTGNNPIHAILPLYSELIEEMYDEAIELIFSSRVSGENLALLQVQDIIEALANKQPINKLCNCGGSDTVALDWDGHIYPCNFFFGNNEYAGGNLAEKGFSFDNSKRMAVEENIKEIIEKDTEKCRSCWAASFCTGCLGNILQNTSEDIPPDFHCQFIKRIVKKIIFKLAEVRNDSTISPRSGTGD